MLLDIMLSTPLAIEHLSRLILNHIRQFGVTSLTEASQMAQNSHLATGHAIQKMVNEHNLSVLEHRLGAQQQTLEVTETELAAIERQASRPVTQPSTAPGTRPIHPVQPTFGLRAAQQLASAGNASTGPLAVGNQSLGGRGGPGKGKRGKGYEGGAPVNGIIEQPGHGQLS
ncbi:putative glucan 1-3-beta-glucosidase D [Venturia nashicola]|nr:putative glucan 1-3-beta-glucosidase D [Venturia nashicola]